MPTTTAEQLQPLLPLLSRMLGNRPSPATLWRWHSQGVKAPDGSRVKLQAMKVGGKLYATPENVKAFIVAQNPPPATSDNQTVRSPEVERRLQCAGLL